MQEKVKEVTIGAVVLAKRFQPTSRKSFSVKDCKASSFVYVLKTVRYIATVVID